MVPDGRGTPFYFKTSFVDSQALSASSNQIPGCHALYYGKTSRNLITRCREHLGINKAGLKIKGSSSAIRDHINQSGHAASVNDFSILDRANNEFDLLIHESLLILRDRPELNSQQSSIPLVLF